jgi:signal transduction histidine kinase
MRQEEFVSHASHELFTPLTTLVGSIDLLADPATHEMAPNLLRMAGDAARRMTQLIDDLMLATGLNGFVACDRIPFDVPARIRLALARFEAPGKTVETRIVEGITAAGDPERFQTALGHILSNAQKFSPAGSTIVIEARQDGDDVVVVVSDEGPGLQPAFREIAFERFSQLDGSDTRRHDGLGLGLFLARQVVRAMGGEVSFEDADRGCRVRIALPRTTAGAASRMGPATSGVRRMYG